MGFLAGPHPRPIAHRGWHVGDLAGCENSLAAFRRAVAEGFSYLETDVHVTSDGVLVAFHDAVLDRVTDGHGPVAAHTYRELQQVRIAGREPIPTLAEILTACPDAQVNIDPKSDAAVGPLLDVLHDADAIDRVCIGSFSAARLRTLRGALGPRLATSLGPTEILRLLTAGSAGLSDRRAVAAQVPICMHRIPIVTPTVIARAHRLGLEVHVWTINTRAEMVRLLDLGVDGIITDRPDILRDVLDERGRWHARAEHPSEPPAGLGDGPADRSRRVRP